MSQAHEPADADALDGDAPPDPATVAGIVAAQRALVAARTDVDPRVLFGVWGVAWLLGFGVLWVTAAWPDALPFDYGVALAAFLGLLVAAVVVTGVHIGRRTAGIRGTSARQGAMYGWSWTVGYAGITALAFALGRAGASSEVITTVMTITSTLVVAVLFMAGGAMWDDRTQLGLGATVGVVTIVAAAVGLPHMLGVMALAGGGGMLVVAGVEVVRRQRRAARRRAAEGRVAA